MSPQSSLPHSINLPSPHLFLPPSDKYTVYTQPVQSPLPRPLYHHGGVNKWFCGFVHPIPRHPPPHVLHTPPHLPSPRPSPAPPPHTFSFLQLHLTHNQSLGGSYTPVVITPADHTASLRCEVPALLYSVIQDCGPQTRIVLKYPYIGDPTDFLRSQILDPRYGG